MLRVRVNLQSKAQGTGESLPFADFPQRSLSNRSGRELFATDSVAASGDSHHKMQPEPLRAKVSVFAYCAFSESQTQYTIVGMAIPPALKRLLSSEQSRVWSWIILSCILAFVALVRFRLRDMPLERDEGEYAYAGQLFLQGIPPAKLAYTIKLPGTHAAYAVLMLLFGQSCAGIHLGFLVVNCATIVLVYLLGRVLAGEIAGCISAAAYALMSLSGDVLGTAAHATHFVVFFALAGLLSLLQGSKTGKLPAYAASGFLLSASVLMKHNGVLFLAF